MISPHQYDEMGVDENEDGKGQVTSTGGVAFHRAEVTVKKRTKGLAGKGNY